MIRRRSTRIAGALLSFLVIVMATKRAWAETDETPRRIGATAGEDPTRTLEPLTKEVLIRRSVETFPSGYLNNISVIQGVALGGLILNTVHAWPSDAISSEAALLLGQATFLFMGILVVSYEYLWFLTVVRWTPTFRDTLVPLVLGVSEIVPQFFLRGGTTWWTSTSIFVLVGAAAFFNTITRLEPELFSSDGREAFREVRTVLWRLMMCCIGTSLFAGTIAWSTAFHEVRLVSMIAAWALGTALFVVVSLSEHALDRVYAIFEIERRPKKSDRKRRRITATG